MSQKLFKLGCLKGDTEVEHSHPAHFAVGNRRIVATAPGSDVTVFRRLAQYLEPPLFLLYVLHTPRGEGEPGRYQSTPVSNTELNSFLDHFSQFLSGDGRFDLWVYSSAQQATVVWDRHNLIFAYGPLNNFESCLLALGFSHGTPSADFGHMHHYRPELDSAAREMLEYFRWSHTPLKPGDEQ
jgi:hypothetical protein